MHTDQDLLKVNWQNWSSKGVLKTSCSSYNFQNFYKILRERTYRTVPFLVQFQVSEIVYVISYLFNQDKWWVHLGIFSKFHF